MAHWRRSTLGLGLLLGGALGLAAGCGSDDKKAASRGDGGEAGAQAAAGAADGGQAPDGSSAGSPGGLGGAGEGGSAQVAGAAAAGGPPLGDGGETNAGGFPAVDCTPAGSVTELSYDSTHTFSVCRGGVALIELTVTDSDQQFVCCGSSSGGYALEGRGLSNNDGGGDLSFAVPENAPLGAQTLSTTCASGDIATPISIEVTLTAPPMVDTVTQVVATGADLTVTGSNLFGVDRVQLVPADSAGEAQYCNIDEPSKTAEHFSCTVPGGTPTGDYTVRVYAGYCGAINSPGFMVANF